MCGQPQVLRLLGHFSELGSLVLMPHDSELTWRPRASTEPSIPEIAVHLPKVAQMDYQTVLSLVLKTTFEKSWFISRL